MVDDIAKMIKKVGSTVVDQGIRKKITASLNKATDVVTRFVIRNQLKIGKQSGNKVNVNNIVEGKRSREKQNDEKAIKEVPPEIV